MDPTMSLFSLCLPLAPKEEHYLLCYQWRTQMGAPINAINNPKKTEFRRRKVKQEEERNMTLIKKKKKI
jgi:hypothetical protein